MSAAILTAVEEWRAARQQIFDTPISGDQNWLRLSNAEHALMKLANEAAGAARHAIDEITILRV